MVSRNRTRTSPIRAARETRPSKGRAIRRARPDGSKDGDHTSGEKSDERDKRASRRIRKHGTAKTRAKPDKQRRARQGTTFLRSVEGPEGRRTESGEAGDEPKKIIRNAEEPTPSGESLEDREAKEGSTAQTRPSSGDTEARSETRECRPTGPEPAGQPAARRPQQDNQKTAMATKALSNPRTTPAKRNPRRTGSQQPQGGQ